MNPAPRDPGLAQGRVRPCSGSGRNPRTPAHLSRMESDPGPSPSQSDGRRGRPGPGILHSSIQTPSPRRTLQRRRQSEATGPKPVAPNGLGRTAEFMQIHPIIPLLLALKIADRGLTGRRSGWRLSSHGGFSVADGGERATCRPGRARCHRGDEPLDCPFSLYPVNRFQIGAEVYCPACNRKVAITLPPQYCWVPDLVLRHPGIPAPRPRVPGPVLRTLHQDHRPRAKGAGLLIADQAVGGGRQAPRAGERLGGGSGGPARLQLVRTPAESHRAPMPEWRRPGLLDRPGWNERVAICASAARKVLSIPAGRHTGTPSAYRECQRPEWTEARGSGEA